MRDAEANGQACRRGTGKAASLTTKTKPAPDGALRYENEKLGTGLAQTASTPEVRKIWSDLAKTWLRFATDLEANERC